MVKRIKALGSRSVSILRRKNQCKPYTMAECHVPVQGPAAGPAARGPPALTLAPGFSPTLSALWLVAHIGAAALPWAAALPPALQGALGAAVVLSAALGWREMRGRGGDRVVALALSAEGQWQVTTRRHPALGARLCVPALVHPAVTVLQFRLHDGRRRGVVLLADNCHPGTFRLLRARLR